MLAMFLPGGLAVSVVLLSLARNPGAGITSYLFGSVTTVSLNDALFIVALAIFSIITIASVYDKLLLPHMMKKQLKQAEFKRHFSIPSLWFSPL